jgi:AcrR family transcriptional regulator
MSVAVDTLLRPVTRSADEFDPEAYVTSQLPSRSSQPETGAERPAPLFRRPTREDALQLARSTYDAGERVDMQTLAWQLGLSRATLHRWFGTREQLLSELLDELTAEFVEAARSRAEGEGDERVFDFIRRLMESTFAFEPSRAFITREPELALRLVLAEDGAVHRRLAEGVGKMLAETRPTKEAQRLKGFVETIVQVGTALEWATFAIGDEPQIARTIDIARALLQSSPATKPATASRAADGSRGGKARRSASARRQAR